MLKKTGLIFSILMVAMAATSLTAFAASTYKIGGIFSVTGRASFLGDPEKKTVEMLVEEVNAKGGIDGRQLELVVYDSEGDPTKAVMAISKLINKDRVVAVIGPSTTPTTLAIVPTVERSRVPLISCAAGVKITDPVKPYTFKTAQSDALAVATVFADIKNKGLKNIGILTVANAFGESGKMQLENQAAGFGLTIVKAESFGAKDTDMTAQLTKIRSAKPDAIICWGTNPGPAVVAKNVKQLKIDVPLYQSHGVASPKFIQLAGKAADGILLPTGKILVSDLISDTDPQKKALDNYISSYETKYKMPVSGFGGYAYDAFQILCKALKGTDGDKKKIRDNLEKITGYAGVSGTFNFSPTEHNGLSADAFVMVEIENGQWKLLK